PDSPRQPHGIVCALHLLSNLGALDRETLLSVAKNPNHRVREAAARLGFVPSLLDDNEAPVRLWTVLSAQNTDLDVESLFRLATRRDFDHITALALRSSLTQRPDRLLDAILKQRPPARESMLELIQGLAEDSIQNSPATERDGLITATARSRNPS